MPSSNAPPPNAPPPNHDPATPASAADSARTPDSSDSPSIPGDIPATCTLILDFHQDNGISCGITSFDLTQIYSSTTNTMVDDIEEVMLSLIHDAIDCSQIITPEEQAVLFSLKIHEISFHHRERGKIVCFLLKHMAIKIRNCLILNRSCPTPEPEVCSFHVVFKSFIPESVRKCSGAPLSAMLPTRTFIGTAPTHAEAASKQRGETPSNKRGLFHDDDAANNNKKDLDGTTIDSHPPDDSGLGGQPKHDRWPNVDRDRIGEFDREPQNSGPSRSHETTSSRRPPDHSSRNENVDLGQSFRVAPNAEYNGPRDKRQHQTPSPTYNQHGFGPPSPSTPGYTSHDEDASDYAYGTQEITADDYFLEFDRSVLNSKDFVRIQMVPAKQTGETWSTWYLRFSLHGTLHGVYIPPWESMDRNKIYGGWFQQFTEEKQRQIRTTMSGLIKGVLNMKGVLPTDSPELSYALTGKDGYHILYGMMRKYHPRLTTHHLTTQIPHQLRNESIHQYLDRLRSFQRQESIYQRPWQERDLVSTALENLLPTIRHAVKPFIHPQLQNIPAGAPLPASLQIDQLSITIEEALQLTGSDRTGSAIAKTGTAVVHSVDESSYFSSAESPDDETNVEEDMDLVLHALSNRAARNPQQCAICEATSHPTDKCFKLEHFLFSKMPVEIPHALKASFQPRLRRLMDNIAGLKTYQPSASSSASPASTSITRRDYKPPTRGKTIRSLLDIAENIDEDTAETDDRRLDDDTNEVAGTIHRITMAPADFVCTTMYDAAELQCNAVEICTSPIGVHSDMVYCCMDAASAASVPPDIKVADEDSISAQVDDGSNTTTTNHQALLWNYAPIAQPKSMQDAGGNRHEAIGIGYLLVPSNQPHGSVPIRAYYTPTIAATIISPSGYCRQLGHEYNTHVVATDHDNGQSTMTIRHRLRRTQDIVINCTSRNGLSFTDPPILPSAFQRTAPLPTKHLHARMIRAAELSDLDPIFDPCDDAAPAEPVVAIPAEPVVTMPLSNSVTATNLRIDDPDDRVLFVNHLNREALRILWHQRLGHMHDRRVAVMHKYAIGVPELPMSSSADQCPTCMAAKMRKSARGLESSSRATQCYQGISIDFGFIIQASKNSSRRKEKVGFNGETCYVLIADHYSGTLHGKAMKTKAPPLQYFHRWLSAFTPNCPGKFVRTDQGGELGKCKAVQELFARHGYDMQLTGADASHQNGLAERPHQAIGNTIRAMLEGASLPAVYWPYAFYHFLRLSNCSIHDGHDFTPFEICSGKPPDLRLLRTFGCRVYVRPPGKRPSKLDMHVAKGIFLGYAKTWKNILWYDLSTHKVKLTTHARFDEGMNDLPSSPPNAAFLKRAQHGEFPPETDDISVVDLDVTDCPFAALKTEQVPVSCNHPTFGLELAECDLRLRVFLQDVVAMTTAANIRTIRRRYIGAYIVSINDHAVFSADEASVVLATLREDTTTTHLKLVFAPEVHIPSADRNETLGLDLDQLRSITALRLEIGAAPQTSLSTVTETMTDDTNLLIHAISNKVLGTPDEQAVGRFTRRKLRRLSTWPIWLQAEFKQLDAMAKQGMYGDPVTAPSDSIVLRQHWTYMHKADGTRKARNCCDGSERAAPELHAIAQTYASCIEQPCMRLFFALCSASGFSVFATDADNAYANSPPPDVPTFVRIDDAYADWYKARFGKELDRSLVLPVRHALQGHPESGSLWERHITKILGSLGLKSTTHERNIYQGTIDDHRVLVCRQVDDLAVACANPEIAKKVIALIGEKVDLTGNSLLKKFNGVDVDQTREYVKLHCTSYIDRLLESHGWHVGHPNESKRAAIEPIPASVVVQIDSEIGPTEHTDEATALAKEMGFDYRSVLGELIYAYTVCRLDIGYAVTKLARHSQAPAACHYAALKRVCRYLRHTRTWGLMYWRPQPAPNLPEGSDALDISADPKLPPFPTTTNPFTLVGYVDAAHATDQATRRSVTGIVFTLCGGAIAYRSKLQPTVSTSSTEAEFIAAVAAAKTAKYLRAVLLELGFQQHGPTTLYEDNQAAILMVNASKPTPRSRHIAIQHFAIQEWKEQGDIILEHIPGIINPADALTKALGWVLHSRHVRRAMGNYGYSIF